MFFMPKEDHTDHAHAEGEEEGLGLDKAGVLAKAAEYKTMASSEAASASTFHWADEM